MTEYTVRTDLTAEIPQDTTIHLLDWAPGQAASSIQVGEPGAQFFGDWRAPRQASDLMLLGAAAYCIDKTAIRHSTQDRWTRDLTVNVPVLDATAWEDAGLGAVLDFLTGDRWKVTPYGDARHPLDGVKKVPDIDTPVGAVGAVCLFSGGLDSLTGVIDLLEGDQDLRLCLLSHHEGGQAATAQDRLLKRLIDHYGTDRLIVKRLFLRPAPANALQARALPSRRENTTRARSLLFLTTALSLAASVSATTPVYIPENGFIGINVPLTRARSGSYSTRTTHPHFIKILSTAVLATGVTNPILNPYRLSTKGEMLAGSKNPTLLQELAPLSISCSHPEAARYVKRPQGNCGYCFPCLIRRSSMAHVGWDGPTGYAWDALTGEGLLDRNTRRASDLRAVINGVFAVRPDREIMRNGPIPDGEHGEFVRVWRAGLDELRTWFGGASGTAARLARGLP